MNEMKDRLVSYLQTEDILCAYMQECFGFIFYYPFGLWEDIKHKMFKYATASEKRTV